MAKRKKDRKKDEQRLEDDASNDASTSTDTDTAASELEAAIRDRERFREQWERSRADYQNLLHRIPRQVEERSRAEIEPLLRELLLVLDYLDMAMASPTESADAKNLAFGVDMVRKQLVDALARYDVTAVEIAPGAAFDPAWHEAVARESGTEAPDGSILSVAKRGFAWRGRVLRHAQVVVAAAPNQASVAPPAPEEDAPNQDDTHDGPEGDAPEASA